MVVLQDGGAELPSTVSASNGLADLEDGAGFLDHSLACLFSFCFRLDPTAAPLSPFTIRLEHECKSLHYRARLA